MTSASRRIAISDLPSPSSQVASLRISMPPTGAPRKSEKGAAKGPQAVLITAAVVQPRTLEVYEKSSARSRT